MYLYNFCIIYFSRGEKVIYPVLDFLIQQQLNKTCYLTANIKRIHMMLIFYSTFCKHFYCFIFIFIPVQACSSGIIFKQKDIH